jgi:NADH-quinone oxidoreductase subunit F
VPKSIPKPRYIVCNADEGEPGTFKDRVILENDPHLLIDGMLCTAWALESNRMFCYIRGEYGKSMRRMTDAVHEAYEAGLLGKNILGSGWDCDFDVYNGSGAYICGEETALLDSLEGKRGHPRLKPPFPAVVGLYGCPTVVNNVETLATIPSIVERGAGWFAGTGVEKGTGPRIFAVSGHVEKPGCYELELGKVTLRELIYEICGGIPRGRALKAVIPGGASTPYLTADEIDCTLDFVGVESKGSFMGSNGVIVMDDTTNIVRATLVLTRFFAHESCGQCTPCREGTHWAERVLFRISGGKGSPEDVDLLLDLCSNMGGTTICALADGAVNPIRSSIQKFREDYDRLIRGEDGPVPGRLCEVVW